MGKSMLMRVPVEWKLRLDGLKTELSKRTGTPIIKIKYTKIMRILSNRNGSYVYIDDNLLHSFFRRRKK